jgi:hypothetical protein
MQDSFGLDDITTIQVCCYSSELLGQEGRCKGRDRGGIEYKAGLTRSAEDEVGGEGERQFDWCMVTPCTRHFLDWISGVPSDKSRKLQVHHGMIQAGEIEAIAAVAVRWGVGIPMGSEVHKAKGCTQVDKSFLVGRLGVMEGCRIDIKVADDDDAAQGAVFDDGV